jgi:hypothetical protein
LVENSFFDVSEYTGSLIAIEDGPKNNEIRDIAQEISQYQFHELEYREVLSFYDNLRSINFLFLVTSIFWIFSAFLYCITRRMRRGSIKWWIISIQDRCWNFMGMNAVIRILQLEFMLVIFSGFVAFRV